jgi:NAD(P)H-flavin reductase
MAHIPFLARVTQVHRLTPLVRELDFRYEETDAAPFQTGQFYMMHVPTDAGVVKRAYSIASSHHDKEAFRLIMKLVPSGVASEYVETLREGQHVEFTGPFGKCVFQTPTTPKVLFVCTGAGLAQHYSMLLSEVQELKSTKVHMLLGVWNPEEIFYVGELDRLQTALPQFSYEFVLDKPFPNWNGKTGFVTQHIHEFEPDPTNTTVYACGNPDMIKGVKKLLMDELHFTKDQIIAEAFTHAPSPKP